MSSFSQIGYCASRDILSFLDLKLLTEFFKIDPPLEGGGGGGVLLRSKESEEGSRNNKKKARDVLHHSSPPPPPPPPPRTLWRQGTKKLIMACQDFLHGGAFRVAYQTSWTRLRAAFSSYLCKFHAVCPVGTLLAGCQPQKISIISSDLAPWSWLSGLFSIL